jgi:hypothetical protein
MPMTKRIVFLALCGALLLPAAAHAASGLHGRSARTQAAFDAALWDAPSHVQVLTSFCSRPSKLRGCTPMSARMRAALEDALGVSITWVDERRVHGPDFVVYAPVVFDGATAAAQMAYREPGAHGCTGGATTTYERQQGVWHWSTMLGWAACSARS